MSLLNPGQKSLSPNDSASSNGLDSPPAQPKMTRRPGDDTLALAGQSTDGTGTSGPGAAAADPSGRALAGVAMMLQGAQMVSSVVPAAIPPELQMMLEILRQTVPQAVAQLAQSNMGLMAMGMGAAGQGVGANPMMQLLGGGMAAPGGMPGVAGSPMAAGGPPPAGPMTPGGGLQGAGGIPGLEGLGALLPPR